MESHSHDSFIKALTDISRAITSELYLEELLKLIVMVGLMGSVGIILAGLVYYLLFPKFTVTSGRHIETVPLACLGLGFAVLIITPVVIGLLFMLGVGYLIALMLLAAYLLHYFRMENGVQRMYTLANRIDARLGRTGATYERDEIVVNQR